MPFFPSLGQEDGVHNAFAKFNTGIERPLIELHQILMRNDDSPFTLGQRELLAAFVSGTNASRYCVGAHTAAAKEFGVDEQLITSLIDDIESAPVDDNLKPVMRFVRKLALEPSKMAPADAEAVFAAGWSERALYDAMIICCTWSFMNRYVLGLGLSVIPEHFGMEGKMLHAGYNVIFKKFDLK